MGQVCKSEKAFTVGEGDKPTATAACTQLGLGKVPCRDGNDATCYVCDCGSMSMPGRKLASANPNWGPTEWSPHRPPRPPPIPPAGSTCAARRRRPVQGEVEKGEVT